MNNFIKARDWLRLSLGDIRATVISKESSDWDHAVFNIQQAVEKACKALMAFLGEELKKTHFPAREVIQEILSNPTEITRLELDQERVAFLKRIVEEAGVLEEEGSMPRYGREQEGGIITPDEIYDERRGRELLITGKKALEEALKFLQTFPVPELKEILENVHLQIERLG